MADFGEYDEETPILHARRNRGSTCWSRFKYGVSSHWNRLWIGVPARYAFAILSSIGFSFVYAMRVNLSVAIVSMVGKIVNAEEYENFACKELLPPFSNVTSSDLTSKPTEFDWDSKGQGRVLGSFFVGYVITQVPGGILAEKYGAKWLFGVGILITGIFTAVTPIAAWHSAEAIMIARFIEGLGEGVTFPAMNALIGRWCPKNERSRISTIIFTGSQIGTVLALALTGYISASPSLGGWPTVFYLFGGLACLWFLFWMYFIYESPEDHPTITKEELRYIQEGQDPVRIRGPTPWRAILTSHHVWALVVTHFGFNWGFYTLLTELPTYLSNILHFELKHNGLLSSLPYVFQAIFAHLASHMADRLRGLGRYNITCIRKIMNSIAFFIPGVLVGSIGLVGCQSEAIIALIIIATAFSGFMYSGFNVTHVDMSPEFAGTLMGITNCVANTSGFLVPYLIGSITDYGGQTVKSWSVIFLITAVIYFATGLVYLLFASAEQQPWGVSQPTPSAATPEDRPQEEGRQSENEPSTKNNPDP